MNDADLEKYLPYLDDRDLSKDKKMEIIEAMHLLTMNLVDWAFDPERNASPLDDVINLR